MGDQFQYNKKMAIDVIEDAIAYAKRPADAEFILGLVGGLYMASILDQGEWEAYLARVPRQQTENSKRCQFCGMRQELVVMHDYRRDAPQKS